MISIAEFRNVELKIAKIIFAERLEASDKLIRLEVDLGSEKRQIIAGIGKAYDPEHLIGKEIVVVANLEPRILMGLESQGMVLAASSSGVISLLTPDQEIESGSLIQ